ncbi:hypothetical protein NBRC10513v2_006754 [Rhodotorula toruloides]|uniref:Carboxylic ester hydrolase n=1 Tax=Rhodotorula toruloides TaxID=5286 RepID=A0A0K3CKQ5_RHOTO
MRLPLAKGALAALLTATACNASPLTLAARNNGAPTANLKNGTVQGVSLPTFSQEAFLGVPFAQPPVGNLRLRKPHSLNTTFSGGSYAAKEYSKFCPGVGGDDWPYELSEDCLYLNVLRPAGTKKGDKLPVGLWIYGGGYQMGGSGDSRYNGSWVVERSVEMGKPIMFVSINYRVAALGFMASEELRKEGNVNLGLYDQRLALNWVQENIAAFGGDPAAVTIMGESAGAMSVSYQLLGYGLTSTNLFRGAILESGNPLTLAMTNNSRLETMFNDVVNSTGCAGAESALTCLRGLSLDAFNSSASAYSWNPVVDGEIISAYPSDTLAKDAFVRVPILIGANTDEGTAFGSKNINTTEQLAANLHLRYPAMTGASVSKLLDLYPNDPLVGCPYNTGDAVLSTGLQDKRSNAIYGDMFMQAGRRLLAEKMAKYKPVYSYRFDQPAENSTIETGTTHFVEVAYVFLNPLKTANTLGNRPGDRELAKLMTSQWVSFIHDQTPNNNEISDAPTWPNYQDSPSNYIFRRHGCVTEKDDYRKEGMSFINNLGWEASA